MLIWFLLTNESNDQNLEQAIRKLWSADNAVRDLGRKEVLQIGSAAAPLLVNLLSDLVQDPRPRFVAEKEEEGRLALKRYVELVRRTKEPLDDSEEYQTVARLAINSRLISDSISLLGELRAIEGVPILVRIMENRETGISEPADIELEALRRIGSPAISSLIESIENAHISAARFQRPILFGYVISLGSEDELETTDDEQLSYQRLDETALDSETKWEIERKTFRIKQKAIKVLGEIGDTEALPFLESLTKTIDNRPLVPFVLAAIREIMREHPLGRGPVAGGS